MSLSIIIPVLNDPIEIHLTIASIRETAGSEPEIIVIDDASPDPVVPEDTFANVRWIRNDKRLGGGAARHLGVLKARGSHVLFTDSHMRFTPGWYANAMERIQDRPTTVHCGSCLGLNENNMDVTNPEGVYRGAKLNYLGSDPNQVSKKQVLEGVWNGPEVKDDDQIECLMGACYFWPREFFLHTGGMTVLRQWGSEEPFTSIKAYLCGGDIRFMENVKIGHKFRRDSPYETHWATLVYNKIAMAMLTMPEEAAASLIDKLSGCYDPSAINAAKSMIAQDHRFLKIERERLKSIQKMSFEELLAKFGHERWW